MPLTPPPDPPVAPGAAPSRADPTTFRTLADAFVMWQVAHRDWLAEHVGWAATNTTELDALQADVTTKQTVAANAASSAATSSGEAFTSAGNAAASETASVAAATTASSAAATASSASSAALTASATAGAYPNTAASNVPRGLTQASVGAITPGAGGTNGTFALGWTGGNFTVNPVGTFTVAGGALTAVTITAPGLYIGAAPTVPTPTFTASAGLTGAAVALTAQFLVTSGNGYWVQSADGRQLQRYINASGVATLDANVRPIFTADAVAPLLSTPVPGSQYGLQDGNGNVAVMLENGIEKVALFEAESINGLSRSEFRRRTRRANLFFSASIVHHISYGQSLSLGNGGSMVSLPSVDGGFFDSVMFNANGTTHAGPRAQEGSGTVAQNHASLIPYQERPLTGTTPSGNVETPLGNSFRMVKRLLRDEEAIAHTDFDYILLGSAPGLSNTAISGLAKGTAPYQRVIDDVTYGLALAQAAGKTYAVDVVQWSHGERDIQDGTSRALYLSRLQQLYTDLNTDIKAITGQPHDIKMLAYQCSYLDQPTNAVALAQLDAAKANPNIIIPMTVYAVEHLAPTQVHLAGMGYATLGAYYGMAVKRCVIEGGTWPTMYPRRLFRQGTILEAEWPDTGFPLAFSTALFQQVANQGFSAVAADGVTDNPIVSVSIVAPRRLRFVLTNASAGKLRYGFISWGGNLHDTCDLDPGLPRDLPLYLPCLTFEESFA